MTTIRVRAIPVGAALQLTRRTLELGPRFTFAGALELMADWWEAGAAGWDAADRAGRILAGSDHPYTFALRILETAR